MQQYATEEAFQTYKEHLALKRHFTTDSYDYHKYRGGIRANLESFKRRRDVQMFYYLSKNRDRKNIILANLLENPKVWVGKLLDDECISIYKNWKERNQNLAYNFELELNKLDENLQENFKVKNGDYPPILDLYFKKEISLEVICVLVDMTNVMDYWKKNINDKIVAGDAIRLFEKYIPFIDYDKKEYAKKMRNYFHF